MKRSQRQADLEMHLPPPQRPQKEPEEGPRWLHGLAGFVLGSGLGLLVARVLAWLFGIPRPVSVLVVCFGLALAGAIWRGRLWRWLSR